MLPAARSAAGLLRASSDLLLRTTARLLRAAACGVRPRTGCVAGGGAVARRVGRRGGGDVAALGASRGTRLRSALLLRAPCLAAGLLPVSRRGGTRVARAARVGRGAHLPSPALNHGTAVRVGTLAPAPHALATTRPCAVWSFGIWIRAMGTSCCRARPALRLRVQPYQIIRFASSRASRQSSHSSRIATANSAGDGGNITS